MKLTCTEPLAEQVELFPAAEQDEPADGGASTAGEMPGRRDRPQVRLERDSDGTERARGNGHLMPQADARTLLLNNWADLAE
ncbi:hypothetical protein ACQP2K_20295 [Microbispora siamensis]